jgi:monoamine oxidase
VTADRVVDAVVVGAGISGLVTAAGLARAGRSVVVLEARGRVGGRLRSVVVDGVGLDLGAAWYWPGEQRVSALVDRLGLPSHEQHLAGDAMYEGDRVQRLAGNPVDVPSRRFTAGAESLAQAVAAELPAGTVTLDAVVDAVTLDGDLVRVASSSGAYEARHVVLALPPALVAATISMTPAFAGDLARVVRATPVWMATTTKVVARYASPFWRGTGHSGSAVSHVGPLRELHDASGPGGRPAALLGFAASAGGGPGATRDGVVDQLVRLFGPAAGRPLDVLVADWSQERFTAPPEADVLLSQSAFGHELYARPALDGRLHWAGTETSRVSPGHVEGALAAAERAVAAVLAGLAPRD